MNADTNRWRSCAWLRTLVFQWHKSRCHAASSFQRPFARDWEELLQACNLISAESRDETFRDAKELQAIGLVDLKTVKYRPYQIERIVIPFAAEPRLRDIFSGLIPDPPDPKFDFASVKWASQLAFVTSQYVTVAPDDLLKLNHFLLKQPPTQQIVPIKERSLEIFGDEKRLDALISTSLFRAGRIDWAKDLKCNLIGEPLGWKRGPSNTASKPIIVIENAATWHTYSRWNDQCKLFSAIVYGCGNRFVDGVRYLSDIFQELGGVRRILYFGDLDPQGLLIPTEASGRAAAAGLPPVEAHLWSYQQLLTCAGERAQPWEGEPPELTLTDWLGPLAEQAQRLFTNHSRLAQEHIGWEFLMSKSSME